MKMLGIFLVALILAGCSIEKRPTEDRLKAFLQTIAPQLVDIQSVTARYSPMKQMSGTTLPDGSLQATCKIVGKLKQDLYVTPRPYQMANAREPILPEAKVVTDLRHRQRLASDRWLELTQALGFRSGELPDKNALENNYVALGDYPFKIILFPKSRAGQTVQFDASIVAAPQVDSWQLRLLDAVLPKLQATFGLPRDSESFGGTILQVVYGTPDYAAYVDGYRRVVESYEATERQIIEKYKKLLLAASNECRDLLKKNATLSGVFGGLPLYSQQNIRGQFSLTKENEGTPDHHEGWG